MIKASEREPEGNCLCILEDGKLAYSEPMGTARIVNGHFHFDEAPIIEWMPVPEELLAAQKKVLAKLESHKSKE